MESHLGGIKFVEINGKNSATIKRCMPVFDAIAAGYIITLPVDVHVFIPASEDPSVKPAQHFKWSDFNPVSFHPITQAPTHPARIPDAAYPKWRNPWAIKTPEGYSTLFVQPMHRESLFTILPGIVDTDEYFAPVHFPMVMTDPEFEGLIPKGTPIAQVIPFKRESWELELGDVQELQDQQDVTNKLHTKLFDKYKSMFRAPKEYK